jgi:hypothetical protein
MNSKEERLEDALTLLGIAGILFLLILIVI